jgi:peptide/nickel transport system ATP-binding protein
MPESPVQGGADDLIIEEADTTLDIDAPYAGPLLDVRDLTVEFPTLDGVVHAVRGVSWELNAGEVLAIVGESGSGKSVTAMAVMGLLPSSARIEGSATFKGVELLGMKAKDLNRIRGRRVAMIFQDPMTSLNPVYTIGWQLSEAVLAHRDVSKQEAMDRAVELLDIVGIPNPKERVTNYPHELSGGMRQRTVIAVAMANNPDVMIADEPTTALDVTVQAQILEALQRAKEETDSALVLITHDLGVVAGMADRVNVMYAGRVVERGTAEEIYYQPRMPYTLGLLGSLPRLDVDSTEKLTPIRGAPPSMINLPSGCPFSPRCPLVRQRCVAEEPALHVTESADHVAACWYWRELSGEQVAAEVFEATAVDDLDAVAVAVGAELDADLGTEVDERDGADEAALAEDTDGQADGEKPQGGKADRA